MSLAADSWLFCCFLRGSGLILLFAELLANQIGRQPGRQINFEVHALLGGRSAVVCRGFWLRATRLFGFGLNLVQRGELRRFARELPLLRFMVVCLRFGPGIQ